MKLYVLILYLLTYKVLMLGHTGLFYLYMLQLLSHYTLKFKYVTWRM